MERLRAENEEEENRLAALDRKSSGDQHQTKETATTKPQEEIVQVDESELEGLDEEEQMKKLLGIEGFGSTKGEKVDSNHSSSAAGAAGKNKARKYRQVRIEIEAMAQMGGSHAVGLAKITYGRVSHSSWLDTCYLRTI